MRGKEPNWNAPIIGVGGTRSPSVETFCLVAAIVSRLAVQRLSIISGGVPGVDLASHLAAIDSPNGSTLAVLANPVSSGLRGHEWSNRFVEARLLKRGSFLSEYSIETPVHSGEFRERLLDRDRIISGLSQVFLAFECSEDSATVDTVQRALLQGKKVFGIQSSKKTIRQGLDQISQLYQVPILSEESLTHEKIVSIVLSSLP